MLRRLIEMPPPTWWLRSFSGTTFVAHCSVLWKSVAAMSCRNWLVMTETAAAVSLSGVSVRPPESALVAV